MHADRGIINGGMHAFWQNGFFADFYFWAAGFFRGFSRRIFLLIFVGKSAQKNPPRKSPAKSSKILTTKIPDTFLQRVRPNKCCTFLCVSARFSCQNSLTLQSLLFSISLLFWFFRFSLPFCAFFPFANCPRILGVLRREKPLLFGVFRALLKKARIGGSGLLEQKRKFAQKRANAQKRAKSAVLQPPL